MKIGETLKAWRISMGLNQTQMAAGIISESYYSKVERGLHNIDADLLIEILKVHDISVQHFLDMVETSENEEEFKDADTRIDTYNLLSLKLSEAINLRDQDMLDRIEKELEEKDAPEWMHLLLKRSYTLLNHNNDNLTDEEKLPLKKRMFRNNNWSVLTPYSTIQWNVWALDFEDICNAISQAIRGFEKLNDPGITLEMTAGATVIEFLKRCKEENVDKKYIEESMKFLKSRSYMPQNLNALLMGAYFEAWFDGNHEKAEKILRSYDYAKEFLGVKRRVKTLRFYYILEIEFRSFNNSRRCSAGCKGLGREWIVCLK